jgi:FMN-binding domain./TAT (twin-arginine translocation) pathway signal sequence.
MSNVVSRRQFLKGSLATAAGVALFGAGLSSKAEKAAAGMYTPGTYSATARGMESEVTVTMTFDADAITDVKIDVTKETAGIGASIGETMEKAILDAQGYEIDAVTGASVTSEAIRKGRCLYCSGDRIRSCH